MKIFHRADTIAVWYIIASIVIGPVLVAFVPLLAPGPTGDCYDSAWDAVPAARDMNQRAAIIQHNEAISQIGAASMMAVGLVVLALLFVEKRRTGKVSLSLVVGVLFMMLGYGLIIWVLSGGPGCGRFGR